MRAHIICFIGSAAWIVVAILILLWWPIAGELPVPGAIAQDHPGAIGTRDWYMNFRLGTGPIDRDILYHAIGHSMDYARDADIIFIGHSMGLFAFDWRLLREFSDRHHIKIYNLSSGGDVSGEFLLRVALKNRLRPKIWIINADDLSGSREFFSNYMSMVHGEAGDVVSYGHARALSIVISKDLKWRFELALRRLLPSPLISLFYPKGPLALYRSATDGNWLNDFWPRYEVQNPEFPNTREPDCHSSPALVDAAKRYLAHLNPTEVLLTVIPYKESCRTKVREVAAALGVPFLSIDGRGMTYHDQGSHLDAAGAKKFTKAFLDQLAQTEAFKKLAAGKEPAPK